MDFVKSNKLLLHLAVKTDNMREYTE